MEERKEKEEDRQARENEKPEDYEDPICVCEAEPRWQELGEELKRKEREPS